MSYQLKWTSKAKTSFQEQISFLEKQWGRKEVVKFVTAVDHKSALFADNPNIYQLIDLKRRIHRCVILKQVSLFYRVKHSHIELLFFWDNRQNPTKLKL